MTALDWLRSLGYVLILIGVGCLPFALGASPKRDLSVFDNLADVGFFWKAGLGLIGGGIACLIGANLRAGGRR